MIIDAENNGIINLLNLKPFGVATSTQSLMKVKRALHYNFGDENQGAFAMSLKTI